MPATLSAPAAACCSSSAAHGPTKPAISDVLHEGCAGDIRLGHVHSEQWSRCLQLSSLLAEAAITGSLQALPAAFSAAAAARAGWLAVQAPGPGSRQALNLGASCAHRGSR